MTGCDYCDWTGEICADCGETIEDCFCADGLIPVPCPECTSTDAPFYKPREED